MKKLNVGYSDDVSVFLNGKFFTEAEVPSASAIPDFWVS